MKARVKATGEIVEVQEEYDLRNAMVEVFYSNVEDSFDTYEREELDFNIKDDNIPDYWTRLEHTYVGMFMKSFLDNFDGTASMNQLADDAINLAHALMEKMKENEKAMH